MRLTYRNFYMAGLFSCAVLILLWLLKVQSQFWDFEGQWIVSTYLFEGVNPYVKHTSEFLASRNLLPIPEGWGTSPWGLVLGQIFYPGFVSREVSKYAFMALHLIVLLAVSLKAMKDFSEHKKQVMFIILLFFGSYLYPMQGGNAGALMCLMLLLSWKISGKHQLSAGVLLAFAMVKPQLTLLFCLYFLIKQRYRLLAVAASIDIFAWWIASLSVHTSMFALLHDFLNAGIGASGIYMGIMTLASPLMPSSSMAMYLSMLVGIVYALTYYYFNRGKGELQEIAPFCVATSFWCYAWGNELLILLPVTVLALQNIDKKHGIKQFRWAFVAGLTAFAPIVIIAIERLAIYTLNGADFNTFHISFTAYIISLISTLCKY